MFGQELKVLCMFLQEPWLSVDEEGEDEGQRSVGGKRFFVSALPLDRIRDDDCASVATIELYQKRPIEEDELVGCLKNTIGTTLENIVSGSGAMNTR